MNIVQKLALFFASAMCVCCSADEKDLFRRERIFTTDKGIRVGVTIAERQDSTGKRLVLTPRTYGSVETESNVDVKVKVGAEVIFSGNDVKSLRVNDFYGDGILCVWAVATDEGYEYRWATWVDDGLAGGTIPATVDMKKHLFHVHAAWSKPTKPPNDAMSAILEGHFDGVKQMVWYVNNCAVGTGDGLGDIYALVPKPIKK